ncbi:MAG: tetratricopeptide repeat protein [Candidatus Sericytochromatia bacterium]
MTIKIFNRKLKPPSIPNIFIDRKEINKILNQYIYDNKKFIYVSAISGFGKSVVINNFFSSKNTLWYSIDDLDKEPRVFLAYLYNLFNEFKTSYGVSTPQEEVSGGRAPVPPETPEQSSEVFSNKNKDNLLSSDLEEFLSQPINNENQIKKFITIFCDELESTLKKDTFLVLDNFNEIQKEDLISNIIDLLLKYCPEKLKIIFISQEKLTSNFHPYLLKQELIEIKLKNFFVTLDEAIELSKLLNKNIPDIKELLGLSQKCISLLVLLIQNYYENQEIKNYYEDNILKNVLNNITNQIYNNFTDKIKEFINKTFFIPKLSLDTINTIYNINTSDIVNTLMETGVLTFNNKDNEYFYNKTFIYIIKEKFLILPFETKKNYIDKIINLITIENSQMLLNLLIEAKLFNYVIDYLKLNYEYYFKNYLYDSLEIILDLLLKEEIKEEEINFINYLKIRLLRVRGTSQKALDFIKKQGYLKNKNYYNEILLEEGISYASLGYLNISIEKLTSLHNSYKNFSINNYLTLINCLGVSYMQNHNLNKAIEFFNKAINLKQEMFENDFMKIYHNLGLTYTWMGDFDKAIEAYEQSIYIAKQFKLLPLAMTYNNLAIVYTFKGLLDKSYQKCINGLNIVTKTNSIIEKINILLTLAETYRNLKNDYKIKDCIDALEDLLGKYPNPILDALFLRLKARIATDNKDFSLAKELIIKAINIRKLSDGDSAFLEYKLELIAIYFAQGLYKEVIDNINEIENKIKLENHIYHLARAYVFKAICFKKENKSKASNEYKLLADELINKNNYNLLKILLEEYLEDKTTFIEIKENNNNSLKITTFGNINVSKFDKEIEKKDWYGKKTKLLLVFLLINKKGSSKELIFQNLFPEGDKTKSALHVMINRLRKAFESIQEKEKVIEFNDDLYSFNFSIDYDWDASNFEYLLNKYKNSEKKEEKYSNYLKALELYKNHFLQDFELESWVYSTQEYYKKLAYDIFKETSDYYLKMKEYDLVLNLSNKFFEIDNCFEDACKIKMKSLMALNKKQDVIKQYNIFENNLKKILNDNISDDFKTFYKELIM